MSEDLVGMRGSEARPGSSEGPASARAQSSRFGLVLPLTVIICLAAAVALIGWFFFNREATAVRQDAARSLADMRRVQSAEVSRWYLDQKGDIGLLAVDQGVEQAMAAYMRGELKGTLPVATRDTLELFRRSHSLASLVVLGPSLTFVYETPQGGAPPDARTKSLARRALEAGKVVSSGIFKGRDGRPTMEFAAPLLKPAAGTPVTGVVVERLVPTRNFLDMLNAGTTARPQTESVLVQREGQQVVYVSPLRLSTAPSLSQSLPLTRTELPAVKAVLGRSGIVEGKDYRGVPVMAAIGPVPGTPWYLLVKQDLAAIQKPIAGSAIRPVLWVVAIILAAGLVLLLFWRTREAGNLRGLVAAETERRRYADRYATLMDEARECIVLQDARGTIVDANRYALELYGYTRDEFIGRDADIFRLDLEVPLADRLREIREHEGHLSVESVQRRKDGSTFPSEINLSVVELDGEPYYLHLGRDITERKEAEAALRASEARYRALFENSLSGFILCRVIMRDGLVADFEVTTANPAAEAHSGLTREQVIGAPASERLPGIVGESLLARISTVLETRRPERFDAFVTELGRHLDVQILAFGPGQFALVFADVTERREAEETIASFFSTSPVALFIVDRDLKYARVNETLAELNGIPAEEHLGRSVRELMPRMADSLEPSLRKVLESGEEVDAVEFGGPAAGPGGTARFGQFTLFPIADPEGRVQYVGGVGVDLTDVRATQAALEESRQFLQRVLGVTPELIYIFDYGQEQLVFSNRDVSEMLGYTPQQLLSLDGGIVPGLIHPDDRRAMLRHQRRVRGLGDGEVATFEGRVRHANGAWLWVRSRDTVFSRDETGAIAQMIGTVQDVTEQRRAEIELERLTQHLEATIMAAPIAIISLDLERRVRLWNPAASAILGWSAAEVIGAPAPFIPPDAVDLADSLQDRVIAGERFAGLDLPFVRKDGVRLQTSTSVAAVAGDSGRAESAILLVEDVGERRANALRLARLSRLYQVLSSVAETLPRVRDPHGLYGEVCRIIVEQGGFLMAWAGEVLEDGGVRVVAAAGDGVEHAESVATELRDGSPLRADAEAQLRAGKTVLSADVLSDARTAGLPDEISRYGFRSAAAVPVRVHGRTVAVLSIYSAEAGTFDAEQSGLLERLAGDVAFAIEAAEQEAARERAEHELAELNAELERRVRRRTAELEAVNAELEAFSYSVSHDLRAPLRALDGFSLALLEDFGGGMHDDAADYLRRIRAASQRMSQLIEDLLTLSRVTRRDMVVEPVDLSQLARSVGRELADAEPEREVELVVEDGLSVRGDAHLLSIAMGNILANSWKFTSRVEHARVEVGRAESDGGAAFFVRDNGAGFEQAYADKLFTPFQRLHDESQFPGTGIGLATVRRVILRHGGRVWAEGESGKGATVWFTLAPGGAAE